MPRPKTQEEHIHSFNSKGLIPLEYIPNIKTKIKCVDKNGFYYYLTEDVINDKRTKKFEKFSKINPYTIENFKKFLLDNGNQSSLIEMDINNLRTKKITLKCNNCGKIYQKRMCHFLMQSNYFCKNCAHRMAIEIFNRKYNVEEVKELFKNENIIPLFDRYDTNKDLLPYSKINNQYEISYICLSRLLANKKNNINIENRYENISNLEEKVADWLKNNKIYYTRQKTFKDLKYKSALRFDFYLIDYNIIIEVDGKQHEDKLNFYNTNDIIIRDNIKNEYCKQKGIKLLRIKENSFDKNNSYKTILKKFLKDFL